MLANILERIRHDERLRWQLIVIISMYVGYAALYMCRATVVISGPAILEDPGLNLSTADWGAIIAWGTAGTLVGKLINGVLADKFGGRKVFMYSLGLCILATGIFGTLSGILFFSIAYFLALFAKSAGWPSMANLISLWYPANWRGRVWGILSSSSRFSSVFTSLVLGSLLLVMAWQNVIVVAILIAATVLLLLYFILKQSPADVGLKNAASVDNDNPQQAHHLDNASLSEALLDFVKSPRVWLICGSIMCLTVLMEFQSFIPIYLKETFGLTAGIAAITSAAFPIGSLISVLLGGFVFDSLNKKQRIYVLGGMMLLAIACIATLIVLPQLAMNETVGLWIALFAIMLFGLAIAPCYYIPMSVFSVDFGGKHCGVLVGIIDAVGYLAAIFFAFIGGAVANELNGWNHFLMILLYVSIAGFITLSCFLFLEHRCHKKIT